MNHERNAEYSAQAVNSGRLDMPVLFLIGQYDYTCECVDSALAEPMRALCSKLTARTVTSGHWMAQEKPVEVNAAILHWLATPVSDIWPLPTAAACCLPSAPGVDNRPGCNSSQNPVLTKVV